MHQNLTGRARPFASAAIAAASVAFAAISPALAHDGDIGLHVVAGAIQTTTVGPEGLGPPTRVFGAEFGLEGVPGQTSEPGFEGLPGTFDPATRIGFNFMGPLLVWNGSGFQATNMDDPPAGELLKGTFLSLNATSDMGPAPGFDLAVQADGGWHRHITWTLLPEAGAEVPDTGVYLMEFQLYSTDPAVGTSDSFWIVFNNDASEEEHDAAIEWVEANLLPTACPADLNHDGEVGGADLGMLIAQWGDAGSADLNGDGIVNGADLGILIASWGPCPA